MDDEEYVTVGGMGVCWRVGRRTEVGNENRGRAEADGIAGRRLT